MTDNTQKMNIDVELLKRDSDNSKEMFKKIDVAIDRLGEVAATISKILDGQGHQIAALKDDISSVNNVVDKFTTNIDVVKHEVIEIFHEEKAVVDERLNKIEKNIEDLNKYKFYAISVISVSVLIFSNLDKMAILFK